MTQCSGGPYTEGSKTRLAQNYSDNFCRLVSFSSLLFMSTIFFIFFQTDLQKALICSLNISYFVSFIVAIIDNNQDNARQIFF